MKNKNLGSAIGPGILLACAAIGGSHLVWSTKAGAIYGWSLIWLVVLANLLKMPFFLYGQRYTAATGESLLAGYKRQSIAFVWIYLTISLLTGMINIAAVSMLAGALLSSYGISLSISYLTLIVMGTCTALLLLGQYRALDKFSKFIIAALAIGTIAAVFFAAINQPVRVVDFEAPSPYQLASFAFLISLLGWMPAPVELSALSSLWMFAKKKETGQLPSPKEATIDFSVGYIATTILALLFVALGALVMHGTGASFSSSGIAFSKQLVELYTSTIGEWSHLLILTAAFFTMFSTSLTTIDGYPRGIAACHQLIRGKDEADFPKLHRLWTAPIVIGAALIILFFTQNLLQLLSFAAVVSFLTSPIIAYINFRVMRSEHVPETDRPGTILSLLSWLGLAFFSLMSVAYIYVTFIK